ncbi:MAG: hypothetical protein IPM69_13585 [Ignavibacteria bacterium]|nr:hypothetical protein [Ignavibacteria bacterium]
MKLFLCFYLVLLTLCTSDVFAIDDQKLDTTSKENGFRLFVDGSLQTAFSKQTSVGTGAIAVSFPFFKIGRMEADINIGTNSDTVYAEHGKQLIRPATRTGFGVELRSVPFIYKDDNSNSGVGFYGYMRTTLGNRWGRIKDTTALLDSASKIPFVDDVNITALGIGVSFKFDSPRPINDKNLSITGDLLLASRIISGNFALKSHTRIRESILQTPSTFFIGFDFLLTINYGEMSVFYEGILFDGEIQDFSSGQGAVGIRFTQTIGL